MEAEPSRRRLRAPNPLSDCTNTISSTTTTTATTLATASSSQSSSTSTVKLKRQNPKLASVTGNLLSAVDPKPSVVPPLIPSTPPRPRPISSSASGTSDREALEPCSVYARRQTAVKGEGKGKENTGSWSCPPAPKTRNAGKKKQRQADATVYPWNPWLLTTRSSVRYQLGKKIPRSKELSWMRLNKRENTSQRSMHLNCQKRKSIQLIRVNGRAI